MTEKELREELDYLRAENAVLKKLEALAQAKKKKIKKRP
jgi:transposase